MRKQDFFLVYLEIKNSDIYRLDKIVNNHKHYRYRHFGYLAVESAKHLDFSKGNLDNNVRMIFRLSMPSDRICHRYKKKMSYLFLAIMVNSLICVWRLNFFWISDRLIAWSLKWLNEFNLTSTQFENSIIQSEYFWRLEVLIRCDIKFVNY